MIHHLKAIHRQLYLPPASEAAALPFTVTPIDEPYLFTEPDIYVDRFEHSTPTVKVRAWNVGGGTLRVERVRIPRACSSWVKRTQKSMPTKLKVASEPLEIELNLLPKELPNPAAVSIAELNLISNARSKAFSKVLLRVRLPEDSGAKVAVPEFINFGELSAWKVSLVSTQAEPVDFFLFGDFGRMPPTRLTVTQQEASKSEVATYDAVIETPQGALHYELNSRRPGAVMPKPSTEASKLEFLQQRVQIANITSHPFSGRVRAEAEWLSTQRTIGVEPYATASLLVSVNVDKLKPGRNFAEIEVADKKMPGWGWYQIVGETELAVEPAKPDTPIVYDFPAKEEPLPVEVVPEPETPPTVLIFEDKSFRFPAAEARAGYLIGDFNRWTPQTLLLEKGDEGFSITLSVPDGVYRFRAEIDGETRLDPGRLQEIVCCSHGVASKIQVAMPKQRVTLRNKSKRCLELQCRSLVEWMRVEPATVTLPSSGKTDVTLVFSPGGLQPGLNLGELEMEAAEEAARTFRAPIFVMGLTQGAVPLLRKTELEFPQIQQGKTEDVPLLLEIFGQGELKGTIQPSTVLRFAEGPFRVQNAAPFERIRTEPLVQVLSDKPSNAYRSKCDASLITNCYLANRRVLPFVAKYEIVHLRPEPPVLYFPRVFLFDKPQTAEISVRRSDDKNNDEPVACTAEIPEKLAQHQLLTAEEKTEGCQFILNPHVPLSAEESRGILHLKALRSEITLPLPFAADIVESRADIQLDGRHLVITNVGERELKIFGVRFENHQFSYTPHLPSELTLSSGESIAMLLKIRGQRMFFQPTVRDTLSIRLNDSQFPYGVYQKEIVADVQGGSLKFREESAKKR